MAIIRYPESCKELRRSVLFGMIIRVTVLVHFKVLGQQFNQQSVVHFRYHCLVITPLSIYPIRLTVCPRSRFSKGQKNITQGLGFDEMAMTQGDIKHSELNNIN